MGKVVPFLLPKNLASAFDKTFVLNNKIYAVDYDREYNEFSSTSIPILLLDKDLLFAMNYDMEAIFRARENHTLNPVVKKISWTLDGRTVNIDYTQNEAVAEKHAQQVFERILAQKKLNEMRNTTSQEMVERAKRELESKVRSLEVPMVDGEDIPL